MGEPCVRHDTVVVRRGLDAGVERVFRAWSDPGEMARWHSPADASWSVKTLDKLPAVPRAAA